MGLPLPVVLLWHLHQPLYRDPSSGRYLLPWARLHGINAYTTMAILAWEFPELPITFNLVPSLLLQIQDYATGNASDPWLEAARKPADELELEERGFLLRWFFLGRPETMIFPHPRYRQLWQLRGSDIRDEALLRMAPHWTPPQLRDLQVWFHLAWTSPLLRERDPVVRALLEKGSDFTEGEKAALLAFQQKALGSLVGRYRRLQEEGAAELSTSPFYHPILPLLCALDSARESEPSISLPAEPFTHPEDARIQIERASAFHGHCFGRPPRGLWPSEGGVSEPVLRLAEEAEFRWIATDEAILHRSVERSGLPPLMFLQAAVWRECPDLTLFFRHHDLSDRIGFRYAALSPEDAVQDLIGALRQIRRDLPAESRGAVITIAVDGENPWESYPGQGVPFLRGLYAALLTNPELRPVTPTRFQEDGPPRLGLRNLVAGSWIDGTFRIWVGHPEDHRAWELLARARQALVRVEAEPGGHPPEAIQAAWEALYAAEGSDWTWWYGGERSSGSEQVFDRIFRGHLQAIYRSLDLQVPDDLLLPINSVKRESWDHLPQSSRIRPIVDGRITHFFEWQGAGTFSVTGWAMGSGRGPIRRCHYGFDSDGLWLRLDPHSSAWPKSGGELGIELGIGPRRVKWKLDLVAGVHRVQSGGGLIDVGVGAIVEVGVPREVFSSEEIKAVSLALTLTREGAQLQRLPEAGMIVILQWSENPPQ